MIALKAGEKHRIVFDADVEFDVAADVEPPSVAASVESARVLLVRAVSAGRCKLRIAAKGRAKSHSFEMEFNVHG